MRQIMKSFFYALKGIWFTLKHERNFQIECFIAAIVFFVMFYLPLSFVERSVLLLTIALVLSFELVNTALERVMDILKPRVHPYARVVKDVMAGAVFIVSGAAVLIGVFIFFRYFFPSQSLF